MVSLIRTTPTAFIRVINGRKQTADLDRMVPVAASHFTLAELTSVYNRARIDYLIPMPMAIRRLREFVASYDIQLADSCVMLDTILSEPVGLGLLGFRRARAWISRFGLVPLVRGQGYGTALMGRLIKTAEQRGAEAIYLELIQDNRPGFGLARRFEFEPLRELIVARRPPDLKRTTPIDPMVNIEENTGSAVLDLLAQRGDRPSWLNQTETFAALDPQRLGSLSWVHPDGRAGWVVFENGRYQLKRVTVGVTAGDEGDVATEVLNTLHMRRPHKDAVIEDMPADDPRWPGYQAAGYFETYRRVEMVKVVKS